MATVKVVILEDIQAMTFEAALEELEDIVRELETGAGDLDASINGYSFEGRNRDCTPISGS
mgnify:CR=1 FL=1